MAYGVLRNTPVPYLKVGSILLVIHIHLIITGGYFSSGEDSKLLKASILHYCTIVSVTTSCTHHPLPYTVKR